MWKETEELIVTSLDNRYKQLKAEIANKKRHTKK